MSKTVQLLQQLEKARQGNDQEVECVVLNELGNEFYLLKDFRSAIEFYEQSLNLAHTLLDYHLEGNVANSLGNTYLSLGETQHAIEYYQQAVDIAHNNDDYRTESAALGNLGSAYANLNEASLAIEYYEQALNVAEKENQQYTTDATNTDNVTKNLSLAEPLSVSSLQPREPRTIKRPRRILLFLVLASFLFASIIFMSATYIIYILPKSNNYVCDPSQNISDSGLCVIQAPDGEYFGVSDGRFVFDTNRSDGTFKKLAADNLKAGDTKAAELHWQAAINIEPNDAEALIQLENQQVLSSGRPYLTFVIATMLSGDETSITIGRSNLQGAYLAQKEYNRTSKLSGGVQVRLLIANIGGQSSFATFVEKQIIQITKANNTLVGVMGWPSSSGSAIDAISRLGKAGIPMVSPSASSNLLTGISPYFFRIAPSLESQAVAGAQYAEQTLHAKRVAIFYDPSNDYSESLAIGFKQKFTADGKEIVAQEAFTSGHPNTIFDLLHASLLVNPDVIYFASSSNDIDDINVVLNNLPRPGPVVMSGDLLTRVLYYPQQVQANLDRLYFTAPAFSNTWNFLKLSEPPFFTNYSQTFDLKRQHVGTPYGYIRPDSDAILAYDSMLVLLSGIEKNLAEGKKTVKPNELEQALRGINGSQAVQGISGQISFGPDGSPVDKAIVILSFDSNNHVQIKAVVGSFEKPR